MVEEIKQENKTESAVEKAVKSEVKTEKKEVKVELERIYVVPLRRDFVKVANYKKARRAVKTLKEFLAKHMKVENRDTRNVRLDNHLNQELWYRGIKNPLHKIKVKAVKKEGIVYAELAELPDVVKYRMQKQEKVNNKVMKQEGKKIEKKEEPKQEAKDETEKEKANAEVAAKENKKQAKAKKHTTSSEHQKKVQPRRTVLQK